MPSGAEGIIFLAGLGAVAGSIIYAAHRRQNQWKEATSQAAFEMGCPSEAQEENSLTHSTLFYQWQTRGLRITFGGGLETVSGSYAGSNGKVAVVYEHPLPFKFSISQKRIMPSKVKIDPEFDRACHVDTDHPERMATLLQDSGLRNAIREMIRAGTRRVTIDHEAVRAQFFKLSDFKPGVRKLVDIAIALERSSSVERPQPG